MKERQRKRLIALIILTFLVMPPSKPPIAHAGVIYSLIVGIATEVTQLANLAELLGININTYTEVIQQIEQLAHEVQMIEMMLKNLEGLADSPEALINTLEQLANVVQQGQVLSYVSADIDNQYAQMYPGYEVYRNQDITGFTLHQKYVDWSRHNLDNIKAALKAAHVQQETIGNERDFIQALKQQSEDAEGRNAILKAANRLTAQEGESLLSLRELTMISIQLHANWMAKQQDADDMHRAEWEQDIGDEGEVNIHDGINLLTTPL